MLFRSVCGLDNACASQPPFKRRPFFRVVVPRSLTALDQTREVDGVPGDLAPMTLPPLLVGRRSDWSTAVFAATLLDATSGARSNGVQPSYAQPQAGCQAYYVVRSFEVLEPGQTSRNACLSAPNTPRLRPSFAAFTTGCFQLIAFSTRSPSFSLRSK